MGKRIIVSVTNDLSTDQRVHKSCMALIEMGYEPLLVGRLLPGSLPLDRPYKTHRMRLFFRKKVWFYAEFQIRLFFFLLFRPAAGLLSNDLDTLLANYLVAKLRNCPLAYDTHEYFCHTPELIHRPSVQKVWLSLEKWIFPRLKHICTVNDSIAERYKLEYRKELHVVRNITPFPENIPEYRREDWGIPSDKYMLINQGSGINIDRGMEEMLDALPLLPDCILVLVGRGDVIPKIKQLAKEKELEDQILIIPPQNYISLLGITRLADVGLSLDKNTNPNYRYSLPNKIFDYIHSHIPVLVSPIIEVAKIVEHYNIGLVCPTHEPKNLAKSTLHILEKGKEAYRESLVKAASENNWDGEKEKLHRFLKEAFGLEV